MGRPGARRANKTAGYNRVMDREVLLFRIDAFTPQTLPMARLAEYLAQLATLYGSKERVHFERLLKGSAVLQASVEPTDGNLVLARVRNAARESAPEDARRAYQRIDAMLRENRAVGEIRRKDGAKILTFPGRKLAEPQPVQVTDHSEVDGVVVRVGGVDDTIPVHLQSPAGQLFPCFVRNRAVAKELASLLYGDPIRVRGQGTWVRSAKGDWKLDNLLIDAWEPLDLSPAKEVIDLIRAAPGNGWAALRDPEAELRRIREGE